MASKTNKKSAKRANKAETITKTVTARGGGFAVLTSAERTIMVPASLESKRVNELSAVGQPVAPLEAYLAERQASAKLARGVDSHNSPHSAKAVADNRRGARSAKAAKARGTAAAVAGKPAKARKAGGGMRGLAANPQKMTVVVKPKDSGLAAGSGRMAKLEFAAKCKTTADFLGKVVKDASGKEHKCDAGALSGMVKRGHVRLG